MKPMLSWFTRNTSKPWKPPPTRPYASEQEQPRTEVPPPKENPSSQERTHPTVIDAPPVATALTSEEPRKAAFTAALSTPHDAVLAELQGHLPGHDLSARTDATPSTSALGMQSVDTLPAAASDAPGSIATSTSPPPESLFDPFTGVAIGFLSPTSSAKNSGSGSGSSEDLWAHLSRIRSLQADVARLHLTMEGIGAGDSVTPHLRSAAPRAVGERLEDDENSDGDGGGGSEAEKRLAREFERSEQRFDRRKEEIGQIMAKASAPSVFFFEVPFELMWGAARSWTRSRRHSRRFMRSIRRCSMPRRRQQLQPRAPQPWHPPRLSHFIPLHVTLTYIASLWRRHPAVARRFLTAP
jgi:hypothetical protein